MTIGAASMSNLILLVHNSGIKFSASDSSVITWSRSRVINFW
jgi:hypothetical protein